MFYYLYSSSEEYELGRLGKSLPSDGVNRNISQKLGAPFLNSDLTVTLLR